MYSDAPQVLSTRRHQMYPRLDEAEIERARRFSDVESYLRGQFLTSIGLPTRGMFVILKGTVTVIQRDGLGNSTPIVEFTRGEFVAEVGTMSGRPSLVDAVANDSVETLLLEPKQLRAFIIAEAELGERLVRAMILRRVSLIEWGITGPVLIGDPGSIELMRMQSFLQSNGEPHRVVDAK